MLRGGRRECESGSRAGQFETIRAHAPTLLEQLRKQFGVTEDSVKGTGQLARVVNALASQQWTGPEGSFAGVRTIYPVLVVHDRGSAAPGFGIFIDAEFRRALLPHDSPGPCPP